MEKENLAAFLGSKQFAEYYARKHCRCDGKELHAHCSGPGCYARIVEGMKLCASCQDRASRRQVCYRCGVDYYVPPAGENVPSYNRAHLCSEQCLEARFLDTLRATGLPTHYLLRTFDNFDPYTPGLNRTLDAMKAWTESDLRTGLFLFGRVGTGKSHLVAGTIRKMIHRGIFGSYINGREFAMSCQSSFSREEPVETIVSDLLNDEFLVVDDMFSEKATEFVRQCLLQLVDQAYCKEKVLLVTSNLNLDQVDQIEPRIASRLAEMCQLLEFSEKDYRIRLAEQRTMKNCKGTNEQVSADR